MARGDRSRHLKRVDKRLGFLYALIYSDLLLIEHRLFHVSLGVQDSGRLANETRDHRLLVLRGEAGAPHERVLRLVLLLSRPCVGSLSHDGSLALALHDDVVVVLVALGGRSHLRNWAHRSQVRLRGQHLLLRLRLLVLGALTVVSVLRGRASIGSRHDPRLAAPMHNSGRTTPLAPVRGAQLRLSPLLLLVAALTGLMDLLWLLYSSGINGRLLTCVHFTHLKLIDFTKSN